MVRNPGTDDNEFMIETTTDNKDKITFTYEMMYKG